MLLFWPNKLSIYRTLLPYHPTCWAPVTMVAAFVLLCLFGQCLKTFTLLVLSPPLSMCHSLSLYSVINRGVSRGDTVFLYTVNWRKQVRNANKICLLFSLIDYFLIFILIYLWKVSLLLKKTRIFRLVKIPLLFIGGQ